MMAGSADPSMCEEEVLSWLPDLGATELSALCTELGLEPEQEITGKNQLYRFILKYLLGLEASDADKGLAKFVQIHSYWKSSSEVKVKVEPEIESSNKNSEHDLRFKRSSIDVRIKDFKISGIIGGSNEKDKLSYFCPIKC